MYTTQHCDYMELGGKSILIVTETRSAEILLQCNPLLSYQISVERLIDVTIVVAAVTASVTRILKQIYNQL